MVGRSWRDGLVSKVLAWRAWEALSSILGTRMKKAENSSVRLHQHWAVETQCRSPWTCSPRLAGKEQDDKRPRVKSHSAPCLAPGHQSCLLYMMGWRPDQCGVRKHTTHTWTRLCQWHRQLSPGEPTLTIFLEFLGEDTEPDMHMRPNWISATRVYWGVRIPSCSSVYEGFSIGRKWGILEWT